MVSNEIMVREKPELRLFAKFRTTIQYIRDSGQIRQIEKLHHYREDIFYINIGKIRAILMTNIVVAEQFQT